MHSYLIDMLECPACHTVSWTGVLPASVLLEGARVDGLPVAEAELEWCVFMANSL